MEFTAAYGSFGTFSKTSRSPTPDCGLFWSLTPDFCGLYFLPFWPYTSFGGAAWSFWFFPNVGSGVTLIINKNYYNPSLLKENIISVVCKLVIYKWGDTDIIIMDEWGIKI